MCILLLIAGFETTVNLIGNTMLALLERPRRLAARLTRTRAVREAAVEETLALRRAGAADGAIRPRGARRSKGSGLPKGDIVVIIDRRGESRPGRSSSDPDEFDLDRNRP